MVCHNRSHNLNHMKYFTFFFLLITLPTLAQTEAFYVQKLAQQLGGQTEVSVKNGRVDIVTDEYAIEVEWANNWKHSIGQALWYSIQTNKKAGIILIMKDEGDYKYGIMLQSTIDYAQIGDKIKVWFYPQDFGGSFESQKLEEKKYRNDLDEKGCDYWITNSTKVRHNKSCHQFGKSKGDCGSSSDGKACKKCGG